MSALDLIRSVRINAQTEGEDRGPRGDGLPSSRLQDLDGLQRPEGLSEAQNESMNRHLHALGFMPSSVSQTDGLMSQASTTHSVPKTGLHHRAVPAVEPGKSLTTLQNVDGVTASDVPLLQVKGIEGELGNVNLVQLALRSMQQQASEDDLREREGNATVNADLTKILSQEIIAPVNIAANVANDLNRSS